MRGKATSLLSLVRGISQDFFFRCYADAVAQAVLYAMFLAYPKSRIDFTEKFRKDSTKIRLRVRCFSAFSQHIKC